tara:strand:- start:107 stop:469 length:363 start_codon:yes stop_codon:yes gene_type:complete
MKFHYSLYLKRKGVTLERFLRKCENTDQAVAFLLSKNLFGFKRELIEEVFRSRLLSKQSRQEMQEEKNESKIAKEKQPAKKTERRRTRRTKNSSTKTTKRKKRNDTSDFTAWKVPYVEPQ